MSKQFAKVTKTYSTKNKLQNTILNELQTVDLTLYPNRQTAKKVIEQLYQNALVNYKGKAAPQTLKSHEPATNKNELIFYVEDVIYISLYNVKIDLT